MADIYTREKRSAIMASVRSRDTRPELAVRSTIHRLGLRFRIAAGDLPGKPDLVLRRLKIAIFVNGCYWHGHHCVKGRSKAKTNAEFWSKKISDNIARDRKNFARIRRQGWKLLVVWECQTRNPDQLRSLLSRKLIGP